ncbi:hypothetical protein B0H11DRAFT_2270110 [Mycena galericulata]|nr:hypothetical protein B0H11DRAFT_2270110 [Mycena galericulata]
MVLHDTESPHPAAEGGRPDAGHAAPHHFCARCSEELALYRGIPGPPKISNRRRILILVAILLSILMFAFAVVVMSTPRRFGSPIVLQLFVAHWAVITIVFLGVLLYMGRRRETPHPMALTSVQIYVLIGLACSWIVFIIAMLTQNGTACHTWKYSHLTCGFFTTVHVLSWFLAIILFLAAYATYRRAVTIHGTALVTVPAPPPPKVEAWRLSNIGDEEGAIKI